MIDKNGPEAAEALLQRVLTSGDDQAASELLEAFFRGLSLDRLHVLLRSDSEDAVRAGAWIASELGEHAQPLVAELALLLDHPARYVRFFVVDAILASASSQDGHAIARSVSKVQDPDGAVRWKALHFLAKASKAQLAAGIDCLTDNELRSNLQWLLEEASDPAVVMTRLDAADRLGQLFAGAAAARLAGHDLTALTHAAHSANSEVSSFAKEEMEGLRR